jgi:hypothetical protein
MVTHGAQYVIYAPYIQRIINYKTEMEFGYDGKHGAYQPHIVRAPALPPPSPHIAVVGTSTATHGSPPTASPPMQVLLLLIGMHLQLLLRLLKLPLIKAISKTF